ncbi:hypothetical protein ADK41_26940 [Streptomyces caelestis]|uniref:Uncharacterized protein n=1 Tax=Streptomyces caelestis TaxID=36816 RepID=A0A0M8QM57_9ACTN|nr:hypothetical protein ADK41_26940 [Streptomyces caelestis]KOV23553.1 hypothetical protein ADK58_23730 [Streptomyces sp. XY152]
MPNTLPSSPVSAEESEPPLRSGTGTGDTTLPPTAERCPLLAWGCTSTTSTPTWRLLSAHSTSNGEVEYCKCSCNAVVMLCQGEVAALTALPDTEPDSRDGGE